MPSQAARAPLPTALVHLLGVELLPIFGFGTALWSAATHIMSHEFLSNESIRRPIKEAQLPAERSGDSQDGYPPTLQEHVDSCVNKAVENFLWTGSPPPAITCRGCGDVLECPAPLAPMAFSRMIFGTLALTALLVAWILISFAHQGLLFSRCGSGAYLHFTWKLEGQRPYRLLVRVMLFATVLTLSFMLVVISIYGDSKGFVSLVEMISMDALALIICILHLLKPRTGVHRWIDGKQLCNFQFRRSWFKLPRVFPETNDAFASKLVEALWQAKNGNKHVLRQLVLNQKDLDHYIFAFGCMPVAMLEEGE